MRYPAARSACEEAPLTVCLALVAHDRQKDALVDLVREHRDALAAARLVATGTTGQRVASELGLPVERVASGPRGGDLQIGACVVEGAVDAVIFLRDPLTAHPHEPDIQALLKVCDLHEVPVATNLASARMLLAALGPDAAARPNRPDAGH